MLKLLGVIFCILMGMGFKSTCVLSHSVVSYSLQPHGLQPSRLLCPWQHISMLNDISTATLIVLRSTINGQKRVVAQFLEISTPSPNR